MKGATPFYRTPRAGSPSPRQSRGALLHVAPPGSAPAGPRMAPAPLVMNPSGLRTCGGDRAEPGPLPFSVESLLEAQRGLGREPTEPREERPRRAAEPRAWFPPSVRASSPRKCPVARSGARLAQIRRTRAGGALSLVTSESSH